MPTPPSFLAPALQQTGAFLVRHSRGLSAGFVVLLVGFAATAFGVAPLLPDPAEQPHRLVVDSITPQDLQDQLEALAEHELELHRSDVLRASDGIDTVLRRLGVADAEAAAFLRRDATSRPLLDGGAGKLVQVRTRADGRLLELVARFGAGDPSLRQFTRLTVTRGAEGFASRSETVALTAETRLASGSIRTSLRAAAEAVRLPEAVVTQIGEIFAADIDVQRGLGKGASFDVVYEVLTADGEAVTWQPATGRVLAAEVETRGKAYHALWFADTDGRGAYFGLDGKSKRQQFLASPMDVSPELARVTSGFAVRFHPLLRTMRAHRGIDYSAPTGTAVQSVGAGVVEFAGRQSGYGNVVEIRHDKVRTTLYAHLSRIDVHDGQAVAQGQRIGAVGATGWATGPHLHFEFRIDGEHVDPTIVAGTRPEPLAVDGAARARFATWKSGAREQLELAGSLAGSRPRFE